MAHAQVYVFKSWRFQTLTIKEFSSTKQLKAHHKGPTAIAATAADGYDVSFCDAAFIAAEDGAASPKAHIEPLSKEPQLVTRPRQHNGMAATGDPRHPYVAECQHLPQSPHQGFDAYKPPQHAQSDSRGAQAPESMELPAGEDEDQLQYCGSPDKNGEEFDQGGVISGHLHHRSHHSKPHSQRQVHIDLSDDSTDSKAYESKRSMASGVTS